MNTMLGRWCSGHRWIKIWIWIAIITDCLSAGMRTARSPGVTISHFVTSNVLGEQNHPPNPANTPDYDSLMEIVHGDFGVKSDVLHAATEEPVYRGSKTKVLPLYIPKGAIPIKLARIARSGSGSSATRPPFRRSRLPSSIISRRQGGPRRPNHHVPPTPSTFLRGWGRRISSKAEPRVGLHVGDSKGSESTQSISIKLPSQQSKHEKVNVTSTTPNSIPIKSSSPVPKPEVVQANKSLRKIIPASTSTTISPLKMQDDSNVEENSPENETVTTPSTVGRHKYQSHTDSDVKLNHAESKQSSLIANPFENTSEKPSFGGRKSSLQRIRETILMRANQENAKKQAILRNSSEKQNSKLSSRIQFPIRSTTAKPEAKDESDIIKIVKNSTDKAYFRLPMSSMKAFPTPTTTEVYHQSSTPASALTIPIPVRRRRPLRTRINLQDSKISPSIRKTTQSSRFRTTVNPYRESTTTPRSTTTTTTTELPTSPPTTKPTTTTSPSVTTAASVRRIHEFFNIPSDRDEAPTHTTVYTTTERPSTVPSTVKYSTHRPIRRKMHRKGSNRPHRRVHASKTTTPNSKSAAEIVLSSLSEVMKDVSTDDMDKIKKIATDLHTLNLKLSERGILIIHAEVDGIIINLRNQTNQSNETSTENPTTHVGSIENSSLLLSEQENLQPQPLSGTDDTSTTIYTPSDKLAYDILNNEDERSGKKKDNVVYDIVGTDEKSSMPSSTTTETISTTEKKIQTTAYIVDSSETSTETMNTKDTRILEEIIATPTSPSVVTTRTRTTVVPVIKETIYTLTETIDELTKDEVQEVDLRIDSTSSGNSYSEVNIKIQTKDNLVNSDSSVQSADENSYLENTVEDIESENPKVEETKEAESGGSSVYLVAIIGLFPLAGVAAYAIRKYLRGDYHKKTLPESEERPDGFTPPTHHHMRSHSLIPPPLPSDHPTKMFSSSPCGSDSADSGVSSSVHSSPWEFTRSKLRLVSVLGEGNFGVVWKAEARGFNDYSSGGSTVLVAVKKVKESAGSKEKCDLLRELSVMQLLGPHPNVVSLLGCCTQSEPHLVIMEYVMFGKLLTFLRDHRTRHNYFNFSSDTAALTSRDLTRFACQVASGCDYLQSKGIIHRDLAARNILVDHNKVCKIADFGMARSIQDIGSDIYEQKSKGALPIRWMAPESLYMNIFTHKSDVWSFGILCWEIVTLGSTPYPGLTAREVMRQVTEGYRLERPDHCGPELYRLLDLCWQQDLNKRPTFQQMKMELAILMEHHTGYIDLENFPEEDYFSMHQNNDEKL